MKNSLFSFFLVLCLGACQNRFDKVSWMKSEDGMYAARKKMLEDVLENQHLKGKTYRQILDLLGEEKLFIEDGKLKLAYEIDCDFGWDIDPVYTKNLYLDFNEDSIVTNVYVKEWKK